MSLKPGKKRLTKKGDEGSSDSDSGSEMQEEAGERLYTVEKILEKRKVKGVWKYRVKWEGYSEKESTWEPAENLENVRHLVDEFERTLREASPSSDQDERYEKYEKSERKKDKESKSKDRDYDEKKEKKSKSHDPDASPVRGRGRPPKNKDSISKDKDGSKPVKKVKPNEEGKSKDSSAITKYGHFEFNDKPKRIVHARKEGDFVIFTIEWHVRPNGDSPLNTQMTNLELRRYDKDLLLDFYEARLKFPTKFPNEKPQGSNDSQGNVNNSKSSVPKYDNNSRSMAPSNDNKMRDESKFFTHNNHFQGYQENTNMSGFSHSRGGDMGIESPRDIPESPSRDYDHGRRDGKNKSPFYR